MRIPTLRGVIDRRILVNFRVDPNVLATLLPSPFDRSWSTAWAWLASV